MGKHSGDATQEQQYVPHGRRMLAMAGGITAAIIAWGFLVKQAITFGGNAQDGQSAAWVFLFIATLGATACMFTTIILGHKLRLLLKGEHPIQQTKPPTPGRRVAR